MVSSLHLGHKLVGRTGIPYLQRVPYERSGKNYKDNGVPNRLWLAVYGFLTISVFPDP